MTDDVRQSEIATEVRLTALEHLVREGLPLTEYDRGALGAIGRHGSPNHRGRAAAVLAIAAQKAQVKGRGNRR